MGFKLQEILIQYHSHKEIMDFIYKNGFEETLHYDFKVNDFSWSEETFSMQKRLGIDKCEICKWTANVDNEGSFKIESNRKFPWIRINIGRFSDISTVELLEKLSTISPKATIGIFNYNSISEATHILLYQNGLTLTIEWNFELKRLNVERLNEEIKTYKFPKELGELTSGEEIISYYWQSIFKVIPVRYAFIKPSLELIDFLGQINLNGNKT